MDEDLDVDNGEDILELPSCIESLVSSAEQLKLLAKDAGEYYIKYLLCYGYVSEPAPRLVDTCLSDHSKFKIESQNKLDAGKSKGTVFSRRELKLDKLINDTKTLELMNSIVEFLPFLNELNSFIERCFVTMEATLKRSTYHLNKSINKTQKNIMGEREFQLPAGTQIHVIFIALMDLMYALISLDKTLNLHTNVKSSLKTFKTVCQAIVDSPPNNGNVAHDDIENVPKTSLVDLIEFINNIQVTLCNEDKSIFLQFMEHVQHLNLILSNERTSKGFQSLCRHFEEFLIFYAENLGEFSNLNSQTLAANLTKPSKTISTCLINANLIPSLYLTNISKKLLGLSSLFILHSWIFKKNERSVSKAFAQTLQKHEQYNLIHLFGSNCYIFLNEFLTKHSNSLMKLDTKVLKQLTSRIENSLKLNLDQELDRLTMKVTNWLVKFKTETLKTMLDSSDVEVDIDAMLNVVCLFEQGVDLVEEINLTIKSVMTIYLHFNKPMTKNKLINLLRMVPLLKSIELSLIENRFLVNNLFIKIERMIRVGWRKLIESARKRLVSLKYSDRKLDTASSLIISSWCSKTEYFNNDRGRIIISLCLSMLISSFIQNEIVQLNQFMSFSNLQNFYERLKRNSDCSYLYWSVPTFSTYYNYCFEEAPCSLDEINYFHLALNDIPDLVTSSIEPTYSNKINLEWLDSKRPLFLQMLGDELLDQFKVEFLDKICQEFEIELRLQTHRDLNLNNHNPFKRHLYNFKQIFSSHKKLQTFVIFDRVISFRFYIEQHLNKVCYNLTALVPSDWFTYDSMINLARHKYDLKFVNSQLPTQNLDHGLDLLDITRNLALFVSRYGYDLSNQLFIEKCSNRLSTSSASSMISGVSILTGNMVTSSANQMLNVVQIKHVSKSLQMHGYGLLNSSVNCTYQVMKRLINLISKQFSHDKLRAILTKEQQLINSSRLSSQEKQVSGIKQQQTISLTFDKANKIAKRFKFSAVNIVENQNSLNPTSMGVDLDSIRQSITQLGNLLAFIRLLKSGALNCASRSVDYLPDLGDLSFLRLEKFVNSEFEYYQADSLQKAAANFDQCLADLEENFSSKTNYFAIIINLFAKLLTTSDNNSTTSKNEPQNESEQPQNFEVTTTNGNYQNKYQQQQDRLDHLKLFYLAVPTLTINFIDYIINCKERVTSRSSTGRFGALISDDGFSMGVAFLLTVLNQTQEFARLEWFKQVREKLESDKKEVELKIEDSKNEESLKQTSSMTLRRLNKLRTEYDGLYYTTNSALLFFRSSTLNST